VVFHAWHVELASVAAALEAAGPAPLSRLLNITAAPISAPAITMPAAMIAAGIQRRLPPGGGAGGGYGRITAARPSCKQPGLQSNNQCSPAIKTGHWVDS